MYKESNTSIDNIWSNLVSATSSGVVDCHISDHCPVFAVFHFRKKNNNDKVRVKFRDFSSFNIINFKEKLNSVNWFDNNDSVDNKARSFIHKFDSLYNSCFPVKSKLVGIKRLRKPWLTLFIKMYNKETLFI